MPVLATLTLVSLLRGGASGLPSFFQPEILRARIDEVLPKENLATLRAALDIMDRLQEATNHYSSSVESATDLIIENSRTAYITSPQLTKKLAELDRNRKGTIKTIVDLRSSLLKVLGPRYWEAVFR